MKESTLKALHECMTLAAMSQGLNPSECVMTINCRPQEIPDYFYDDEDYNDDECNCNVIGCPECDERYQENYDCGMMPDGQCSKAGSEECDWECPMNR